ncbi:MAG: bifunctional hydroxymethylpyrimidine kinase/phosphomethylpyrimidine kinase [candidate division Zixibacteria bacterium]|nr:bifunctional hydroxymethylpyrimidine kinase/phosphomethylpyrimidine kinase [candidate division Zixibacteria bacterium]
MRYRALTIAGSDSGGGAGIQADLKTFAACGVYGMSAITSVTAQNTVGVQGVYDLAPDAVAAQIVSVLSDIGAQAIKTGMLSHAGIIEVVADTLKPYPDIPLVIDPVMVSKSGAALLDPNAVSTLVNRLFPLATVLTPNLHEVRALTGLEVSDIEGMRNAAVALRALGPAFVVVKGGHLAGRAIDILYDGHDFQAFETDRIETTSTHGTGCTFASAIAAELAKGCKVPQAVENAKAYLTGALQQATSIGAGHGPVNHFYTLYREEEKRQVLESLSQGVQRLETGKAGRLVPEVQSNLGMGLAGARTPKDVAAFPGRLIRLREDMRSVAAPEFGASSHIAKIVLTAMRHDPDRRAVMNIRYTEEILAACQTLGLSIGSFDRHQEPKDVKEREGSSLEWGTAEVIRRMGTVPDIIYDLGDEGKEPMIRIIGTDPLGVAETALRIVRSLHEG